MEKTNKKGFLAWFTDNWKRKPLFSTGIALLVMVILQILALGFDYASFGEWFAAFSRNWINILRNNAWDGFMIGAMPLPLLKRLMRLGLRTLISTSCLACRGKRSNRRTPISPTPSRYNQRTCPIIN